jgi:hypothetical protein
MVSVKAPYPYCHPLKFLKTNSLLIKMLVETLMSLTRVEIEIEGWT